MSKKPDDTAEQLKVIFGNPDLMAAVQMRLDLMRNGRITQRRKGSADPTKGLADMRDIGALALATARDLALELYHTDKDLLLASLSLPSKVQALKTLYTMGREALNIPTIAPLKLKPVAPKDWNKTLEETTRTLEANRIAAARPVKLVSAPRAPTPVQEIQQVQESQEQSTAPVYSEQ